MGCQFIAGYAEKNTPNYVKPAPVENKNTTTAKTVVEKTEALAKKIDEAKAISQKTSPKASIAKLSGHAPRISGPGADAAADRVVAAVGAAISGETQGETQTMAQFNEQFTHFQDDAPACDVCGSICVRNGTCYRCFNCGNSMGCS
jgi:ribonucleoside-diphosphate reductase alpha chain